MTVSFLKAALSINQCFGQGSTLKCEPSLATKGDLENERLLFFVAADGSAKERHQTYREFNRLARPIIPADHWRRLGVIYLAR